MPRVVRALIGRLRFRGPAPGRRLATLELGPGLAGAAADQAEAVPGGELLALGERRPRLLGAAAAMQGPGQVHPGPGARQGKLELVGPFTASRSSSTAASGLPASSSSRPISQAGREPKNSDGGAWIRYGRSGSNSGRSCSPDTRSPTIVAVSASRLRLAGRCASGRRIIARSAERASEPFARGLVVAVEGRAEGDQRRQQVSLRHAGADRFVDGAGQLRLGVEHQSGRGQERELDRHVEVGAQAPQDHPGATDQRLAGGAIAAVDQA